MKAHVRNGRLVLDEPSALPEGSEVNLVPVDSDELDDDDRRRLHEALASSESEVAAGDTVAAQDVLAELRSHR